jgi:hypothetical protein
MLRTNFYLKTSGAGRERTAPEGGSRMILREIVFTCSNPYVARAAVASIGGDFARRFSGDAAQRNLPSGLLAARLVRHFARNADEIDWEGAREATRGADMPILAGLRYILERGLERAVEAPRTGGWIASPPALACMDARPSCA